MDETELVALLVKECAAAGSQAAWAKARGVTPAYVSDVVNGRRDPGPSILMALGCERVVTYRRCKPT